MPTYYRSTERRPGRGIRKSYRHGGRNRRDEEARVIGVQDNAADELRRVRGRRPKDAREVRDRRAQLARVGSRERNARDEMRRLRGYQMGGGIDSLPRPLGLSSMMQPPQRGGFSNPLGSQNSLRAAQAAAQQQRLQGLGQGLGSAPFAPPQPARRPGQGQFYPASMEDMHLRQMGPSKQWPPAPPTPPPVFPASMEDMHLREMEERYAAPPPNRRYVPDQTGTPLPQQFRPPRPPIDQQTLARMAAAQRPRRGFNAPSSLGQVSMGQSQGRGIAPVQRGSSPKPWFPSTQRPEYLPETQAQFVPWARGGRVGLKTGGRIPRKKGAKFI
jgi:hypothetical protein